MNPTRLTCWCSLCVAASVALAGCGNDKPAAPTAKAEASAASKSNEVRGNEVRGEDAANPVPEAEESSASNEAAGSKKIAVTSPGSPAEGDWGTLKGKFVYSGTAPVPAAIDVNKDPQFCGNKGLVDESIVVGGDGELANVIVWITSPGVKIHSDFDAQKKSTVTVGNKNCRFEPRVVTYWTAQPLELRNFDAVNHNFDAGGLSANTPFNDSVPANSSLVKDGIEKAERLPAQVNCGVHPWMHGWLLVQEHPYMAVSAADGTFEIKNVPTGELEFQFWHEKAGYVRNVEVDGKPTEWKRGRVKLTIEPGDNDLGVVKVAASLFNK